MTPSLPLLKVLPDQKCVASVAPEYAHYHSHRFIATHDAEWDEDGETLVSGSLICAMRDLENQAGNAETIVERCNRGGKALDVLGRLHDGLSDILESGRLTEGAIPDDYQWLVSLLVNESLPLFAPGERVKPADVSGAALEDADGALIDSLATALGEVHEDEIEHEHYGDGEDCSTCAALRAAEVRTGSKYINDPDSAE